MYELKVQNINRIEVVDSRDIASAVGKSHRHLLDSIRQYIDYMEEAAGENPYDTPQPNFRPSDFFIEATYLDGNGRDRPNYLVTKMGCEMIANKMVGKKGMVFTAAYVTAFNKMLNERKQITAPAQPTMAQVRMMELKAKEMHNMGCSPYEVAGMITATERAYGLPISRAFSSQLDPQFCLFDAPALPTDAPLMLA